MSGVRTPRWRDPDLAAAYIASHTIPPVAVVAELVEAGEGLDVLVIEVSKATGIVATNDGKVLKRRLKPPLSFLRSSFRVSQKSDAATTHP